MVLIKKQLVNSTRSGYPGINGRKFITIHETANTSPGADAQTHANLQSNGFTASWHWQVDDKEAIQSFEHTARLWHAGDGRGDGNMNSIGIEICVNRDGDFKKAVENAAELVKKIMKDEGIPQTNVVQHHRWSSKNCPTNLRNGSKGIDWADFNRMISSARGDTSEGQPKQPVTTPSAPKPRWTKVTGKWSGQTLGKGEYGEPVRQLQTKLSNNNPQFYPNKQATNNGIDSYYGDDTEDAVRRFQSYYGLSVDGLAGKQVYNKLNSNKTPTNSGTSLPNTVYRAIRPYPSGSGVRAVQEALASVYYYPDKDAKNNGVDGVYGPKTADAVRRFQLTHGLAADEIYGPATKKALENVMN
ncbi:N-acetylmuramoyl-L-alanine amidase [Oceanobacillus longus]|uniref:N-acetylmuramoyl-L-alanine amidase n=1 Tax=Oceanobacillus longus TaxID=930120 RepID=A0ABV8H2R6_9BACI